MQWNPLVAFLLIVTWLTPIPAAQDPRTAQRRQGRKTPPVAPSFPVAAPLPATVADERVVEVRGQISDIAVDYRKVYWLRIYPNFTCEIRLPDECTGLVVGNPKLFLAYALEIEKVKNKDGTEYVRRDNRVIIVQPQLGDSERGNLPVECSMSVPLRNRKTIFFNLQIAQSKPESNFQVNIRDGEAERIEVERFRMQEAARREAEARRTQDEKSVATLTGRWQTFQPQGGKAAASKQTTVGTFELYLLREDRFLLAALVEPQARGKAKPGKPAAPVNRLWLLDGSPVIPKESSDSQGDAGTPVYVVTELPATAHEISCRVSLPGKKEEFTLTAEIPVLTVPVEAKPAERTLEAHHHTTPAEPPQKSVVQPGKPEPQPVAVSYTPAPPQGLAKPAEPVPASGSEPRKKLQAMLEVANLKSPLPNAVQTKEFELGGECSQTGELVAVVITLRRKLGSSPLRLAQPKWSVGGVSVAPVWVAAGMAAKLETRPLSGGFLFLAPPGGQERLTCTVEIAGKPVTVSLPLKAPTPAEPASTAAPLLAGDDRIKPLPPNERPDVKAEPKAPEPVSDRPQGGEKREAEAVKPDANRHPVEPPVTKHAEVQPATLRIPARVPEPRSPEPKKESVTTPVPKAGARAGKEPKPKATTLFTYEGDGIVIKVLELALKAQQSTVVCEVVNTGKESITDFQCLALEVVVGDGIQGQRSRLPEAETRERQTLERAGDYGRFSFTFNRNVIQRPLEFRWRAGEVEQSIRLANGDFGEKKL